MFTRRYQSDNTITFARGRAIGVAYRKHMGRHFPAMTLAGVSGLFDERAKVEIEAVAMLA